MLLVKPLESVCVLVKSDSYRGTASNKGQVVEEKSPPRLVLYFMSFFYDQVFFQAN